MQLVLKKNSEIETLNPKLRVQTKNSEHGFRTEIPNSKQKTQEKKQLKKENVIDIPPAKKCNLGT